MSTKWKFFHIGCFCELLPSNSETVNKSSSVYGNGIRVNDFYGFDIFFCNADQSKRRFFKFLKLFLSGATRLSYLLVFFLSISTFVYIFFE